MKLVKFARAEDAAEHETVLMAAEAQVATLQADITRLEQEIVDTEQRKTTFYAAGDLGKHDAAAVQLRRHQDALASARAALLAAEQDVADAVSALQTVEQDARRRAADEHLAQARRHAAEFDAALAAVERAYVGVEMEMTKALNLNPESPQRNWQRALLRTLWASAPIVCGRLLRMRQLRATHNQKSHTPLAQVLR